MLSAMAQALDYIKYGINGGQITSKRDVAQKRGYYNEICEKLLDYWNGGAAQKLWLQSELVNRFGEERDPRENPINDEEQVLINDEARVIREGRLELFVVPFLKAVVEQLAVLYAADDFERLYTNDDDRSVDAVIKAYHKKGKLTPKLHLVDAWTMLFRMVVLQARWCEDLGHIVYDVLPPHWVWILKHPAFHLEHRMAYAVAWSEKEGSSEHPNQTIWCAYQRPPVDSDPADAPTWLYPYGRCVRYAKSDNPWPIPTVDIDPNSIIEERINEFVEIGGMDDKRMIWHPLVFHWAEPPTEDIHMVPAEDLAQANLELDVGLSLLLYVANTQSAGIPYMTGGGSPPRKIGPTTLVTIDEPTGSFGFASPGANIGGHLEVLKSLVQIQSMLRHLAPDTYSLQRPSIQTGPAKMIEQYSLTESRYNRTLMADASETERFELERLYHNAYGNGPDIPWETEQTTRWGEMRVPMDLNQLVTRLGQEIDLGISTLEDAVMERYGLSREAARAKLEASGVVLKEATEAAIIGDSTTEPKEDDPTPAPAPEPPKGNEPVPRAEGTMR